ncbi:2-halobenzoate 1,2-dioxygenase large subunit [Raoultella planticola]|uniref:2-halobenzoate 1,2-dioxygenase large subunit n=1 Tax=Raoultella planticola TaxID=575 RepID=A0A485D3L8_RAOPL|nr:2-halobenzoate 1,2-dioxygenase large subunit [Raoultella planticola]
MPTVGRKSLGGGYGFENGHMLLWTRALNPEVRPVFAHQTRLQAEFGELRADQMVNETRNLCLYPNVYLMDQFSTQIRVIRPLAVDKTEVTIWCFARKVSRTRPARCAFVSTRISLTSAAWERGRSGRVQRLSARLSRREPGVERSQSRRAALG